MWPLLEYLEGSALVADIQKKFGIEDRASNERNGKGGDCNLTDKKRMSNGFSKNDSLPDYVITKKLWYYIFSLGTALGDEIFYASFIPFWFWNIDGAVGRRVVLIWCIIMYVGQGLKDVIKWPRPTHPAKRLQKKWSDEYGMPSTHAMVGIALPFSVLFYTMNRYIYPLPVGFIICISWCSAMCVSRIYFGMHTVLDVIAGLCLAIFLMMPLLPAIDALDNVWVTNLWTPLVLLLVSFILIKYFPHTERWTPTRGDTTVIIGVSIGIQVGAWINYQLGNMTPYPNPPPYKIIWPDLYMLGLGGLRTLIGLTIVYTMRSLTKRLGPFVLHSLMKTERLDVRNVDKMDKRTRNQLIVIELVSKYFTYFVVGINTSYSLPIFFRYLGIERPTFYTEL